MSFEKGKQPIELETSNNSEFKMFGALKQLDPGASERIGEKYRDVLSTPRQHVSTEMADEPIDVAFEARIENLRNELTDALIASVHNARRVEDRSQSSRPSNR